MGMALSGTHCTNLCFAESLHPTQCQGALKKNPTTKKAAVAAIALVRVLSESSPQAVKPRQTMQINLMLAACLLGPKATLSPKERTGVTVCYQDAGSRSKPPSASYGDTQQLGLTPVCLHVG